MTDHAPEIVGATKGPGETPHEFTFVTPDRNSRLKHGEFVYYVTPDAGAERRILGQIVGREPLRLYPDTFLADPGVPPADVAGALGFNAEEYELFQVTVRIVGYYDTNMNAFVNPRTPPRAGWPIYIASSDMLSEVLSVRRQGERGSAHIGSLLSRPLGEVPVVLNVSELASTHLAILAATGAGKSYLAGVLVEEMLSPQNKGCILIVDPHGEYGTLSQIANKAELRASGYQPKVKVFRPEHIKVRVSHLLPSDVVYLLPSLSDRMGALLRQALGALRRGGQNWTLDDLMAQLEEIGAQSGLRDSMSSTGGRDPSVEGLRWRLQDVIGGTPLFDNYKSTNLRELFEPGQCTVLQLDQVDRRVQQIVVATILRRLTEARMETERGRFTNPGDDMYLPYPVFVLVEEAHHFAPAGEEVTSTNVLKQILAEGRKFGIGVGLVSQRPGKLDSDVLSQCMTSFIMRIVNPIDQQTIASSIESVGRELLDELPALSKGQVIVAGAAINVPVLCSVRKRLTEHGGESIDAPAEWEKYLSPQQQHERARESVPLAHQTPYSRRYRKEE